ncbi:hypothetical protein AM352_19340 [Citrobacter koseri]|uniref:Uncharacterized protein n=1 Tax=Citrobacter koseri (strain ATCC BAA-895 / CDC 4225-83 / SGSC4696) TaxID=290338 RepID=A8AJ82_CITK8|nr:hypothetical protein CKO_02428 [Citrobacter koseri ATCC BAA-895]AVE60366.1 hypothetical protein AM352_19340 [Citrobacter koseri]AYY76146.1 hypothetical protein EGX86_20895 [Citrobacter koseri]KXA05795.1 hypothetical protein HMPREF3207_00640 [Citrobacter koseri]KXB47344.1 hypothetical protein HMPREF0208_00120 [Citrobacter koseri]
MQGWSVFDMVGHLLVTFFLPVLPLNRVENKHLAAVNVYPRLLLLISSCQQVTNRKLSDT